jgi:hypothetical protein
VWAAERADVSGCTMNYVWRQWASEEQEENRPGPTASIFSRGPASPFNFGITELSNRNAILA